MNSAMHLQLKAKRSQLSDHKQRLPYHIKKETHLAGLTPLQSEFLELVEASIHKVEKQSWLQPKHPYTKIKKD